MREVVLCVLVLFSVPVVGASFADTGPPAETQPETVGESLIQVEQPHNEDTSVRVETNSQTKLDLHFETTQQEKQYWIGIENTLVYETNDGVEGLVVTVGGDPVEWEEREGPGGSQWIVFSSGQQEPQVVVQPSGFGGPTDLLTLVEMTFLESPVTLLVTGIVVLTLGFFGVRWIRDDVEWIHP